MNDLFVELIGCFAPSTTITPPPTLGGLIDRLYELKQDKAELNRQIKHLDTTQTELEAQVLIKLQELGINSGKSLIASATISTSIIPIVQDWEAFYNYIKETDSLFLLERRPALTAYRDLAAAGEKIPGVESFTKTTISLRKL
jgi:hypothetical protein